MAERVKVERGFKVLKLAVLCTCFCFASAAKAGSCSERVQKAAEEFAQTHLDLVVDHEKTFIQFNSSGKRALVELSNKNATQFRDVLVTLSPMTCEIQKVQHISADQ